MSRPVVVVAALVLPLASQVPVALSPSSSRPSSMAFDSGRNRLVEFSLSGEVFEYDGALRLHRANASPTGPGPRLLPGLVYDPIRRHVLLFGGYTTAALDDTWAWDGTGWRELTGTRPPSREAPGMTFDSARGRVVMFGGQRRFIGQRQDTWEHDGQAWIQRSPATVPFPANSPTMCFDSVRGVCVMTMPSGVLAVPCSTWEWNGADWTQRVTTLGPPSSNGFALAFDPVRRRCVSLGGGTVTSGFQVIASPGREVWEYDGTSWRLAGTLPAPLRRFCYAWYDTGLGVVRVAGGTEASSDTSSFDFASWNGATLTVTSQSQAPTPRVSPMIAGSSSGMLLFGGWANLESNGLLLTTFFNDTWVWGDSGWQRATSPVSPPPRVRGAMRYRLLNDTTVLFGGWSGTALLDDFWEWRPTGWTQLPVGPPPRQAAALAEDIGRSQIVLFGGATDTLELASMLSDTWVFDGATWVQRVVSGPSPRMDAAMAYDPSSNQVVLYGGRNGLTLANNLSDTWSWNGAAWTRVTTLTTPPAFTQPSLDGSLVRGQVLLGDSPTSGVEQLWVFRGQDWSLVREVTNTVDAFGRIGGSPFRATITYFNGDTVREWSDETALVVTNGAGCGAPVPRLAMRSRPRWAEQNSGLELETSPGSVMLFAVDVAAANVPIGGGCTVLVGSGATIYFAVSDARGLAVLPWAVPLDPALRGLDLFAQAAVADAVQPLGFALSGSLRIRVGD